MSCSKTEFTARLLGLALLCASVSSCDWLKTPRTSPSQPPEVSTQDLPYFTMTFNRTDGQPITRLKSIEVKTQSTPPDTSEFSNATGASLGTSTEALTSQKLAIRKLRSGEKLYFSVDLGPTIELAQFTVSGDGCAPGQYLVSMAGGGIINCAPTVSGPAQQLYINAGEGRYVVVSY